jgi:hypothetical protein
MTSSSPTAEPATQPVTESATQRSTGSVVAPDGRPELDELDELRLRVAAQDRLIEAILAENEDIHALRRRNHELEQYMGKLLGSAPAQAALKVRRKILRRPAPE